jgi:hypothetical protein
MPKLHRSIACALFLLLPVVGCDDDEPPADGGTSLDVPDAGAPDAGTPDAGAPDAGTPDAGTPDAPDGGRESCPATRPSGSGSEECSPVGLVCEFYPATGADLRPSCRTQSVCGARFPGGTEGVWGSRGVGCGNDGLACLSEPEMRAGAACTATGTNRGWCEVATGVCVCASGHYVCDDPTATAGCPAHLANLGSPCPTEGLTCVFGPAGSIVRGTRVCQRGLWRQP